MALSDLEEQCFAVLSDEVLDEDDRVDQVEELVRQRYPKMASKQRQKIAMDIMWKHKDPSRQSRPAAHIVNVRDVESTFDIPDLERRLQLERQFLELDALNRASETVRKETYQDLLAQTNELKQEIYGDNERPLAMASSSPIDHISSFFSGSVPRTRINQALKSTGYSVLDAVQLIIGQLKQEQGLVLANAQEKISTTPGPSPAPYTPSPYASYAPVASSAYYAESQPFFDPGKKNKAICTFLLRDGKCLRSDCQFSHDIEQRVCAFWLNGRCVAGDECPFKHSLDDLSGYDSQYQTPPQQDVSITLEELFPPLPSTGTTATTHLQSAATKTKRFNVSASSFTPSSFSPASVHSIPTFAPSLPQPPQSAMEPYSAGSPLPTTPRSSAISIVKPLRKPKVIPWEATENEYLKNYVTHRNSAIKFENQRKKFAQISTDSWKANDGARSKQMSDKANKFELKCFDALKLADDELYNYSESTNDEVWFEFHGLEFNEAVEQLDSSLKELKAKSRNQSKVVFLVVPAMTYDHNGYKKTTKPISLWLDHEGYRWQLYGSGNGPYGSVVAIDPWSK